jgi:HlyD family secretion protein
MPDGAAAGAPAPEGKPKRELFSEEALEQAFTPEGLDSYLKVVRPKAWIAVLALVFVVAGALIWGFTGELPRVLPAQGIIGADGDIVSYLPVESMPAGALVGCKVNVTTVGGDALQGTVSTVSEYPLSQEEIVKELPNAWTAHILATSNYAYRVVADATEAPPAQSAGTIARLSIVVSEEKPIEFLLN